MQNEENKKPTVTIRSDGDEDAGLMKNTGSGNPAFSRRDPYDRTPVAGVFVYQGTKAVKKKADQKTEQKTEQNEVRTESAAPETEKPEPEDTPGVFRLAPKKLSENEAAAEKVLSADPEEQEKEPEESTTEKAEAAEKADKTEKNVTPGDTLFFPPSEKKVIEPEKGDSLRIDGPGQEQNSVQPEAESGKKSGAKILKILIPAAVLVLLGVYTVYGLPYREHYFPNTEINGQNVSGLTASEAEDLLNGETKSFELTIHAREQEDTVVSGADAGLSFRFDDTLDQLVKQQNFLLWGLHQFQATEYKIPAAADVDETKFGEMIAGLPFLQKEAFRAPEDAHISDLIPGTGYTVVPEDNGTTPDTAGTEEAIRTALCSLTPDLDLEAADVYEKPTVFRDDAALNTWCDTVNPYVSTVIRYSESGGLVLDGNTIRDWITVAEDNTVTLDQAAVTAFAAKVAEAYDTWKKEKPLHTSWGQDITVKGGSYGWKTDQAAEAAWLTEKIPTGADEDRMPEFTKTAASHGAKDYGDTYVEVNLTAQHLYFYKDGQEIVSTDFVSGNVSKGTITHTGVYQVAYKQRNATLKGQGYATPVSYWMPFNGGEGLHDATWRGSFGGSIYKTNGSHGCVNLPLSAAKKIFENISAGTPVIVYTTTANSSSSKPAQTAGTAAAAGTDASAAAAQQAAQAAQGTDIAAAGSQTAQQPAAPAAQETKPAAAQETQAAPQTQASPEPSAQQGSAVVKPAEPVSSGGPSADSAAPSPTEAATPAASSGPGTVAPAAPVSDQGPASADSAASGPGM